MLSEVEQAIEELRIHIRSCAASTIFVAVNDYLCQAKLCSELQRDGHRVSRMSNGIELLEKMANDWMTKNESKTPDLIIIDVGLKGFRGIDLLVNLRKIGFTTPFILLAGKGEEKLTRLAARFSGVFVFEQPFDVDDLRTAIANLLVQQQRFKKTPRFSTEAEEKFNIRSSGKRHSTSAERYINAVSSPGAKHTPNKRDAPLSPVLELHRKQDSVDRREAHRIPLEISVERIGRADYLFRTVLNISTGGIMYQQKYPQRKDAIVNLEFMIPGLDRPVQVNGKVLHTCVKNNMFGMGARFLNLAGWAREGIENLILRSC